MKVLWGLLQISYILININICLSQEQNIYVSIDRSLNENIKAQTSFYFKNSDIFKVYKEKYIVSESFEFFQTYDNTKKTNEVINFELPSEDSQIIMSKTYIFKIDNPDIFNEYDNFNQREIIKSNLNDRNLAINADGVIDYKIDSNINPNFYYNYNSDMINLSLNKISNDPFFDCTFSNDGMIFEFLTYNVSIIKIDNFGAISFAIFNDSKGIYIVLSQEQKLVVMKLDTYIENIMKNIPNSQLSLLEIDELNFINIFVVGNSINFRNNQNMVNFQRNINNFLIGLTDSSIQIYKLINSNELSSIIYIRFYAAINNLKDYVVSIDNITKLEMNENYIFICQPYLITILEKSRFSMTQWTLVKKLNYNCIDIQLHNEILYIAIQSRGLFTFDIKTLNFFNDFISNETFKPIYSHPRITKLDLISNSSNNDYLGIMIRNEPETNENEFFLELELFNPRIPTINRVFLSKDRIVTYNISSDYQMKSFLYDRLNKRYITLSRGTKQTNYPLTYTVRDNIDISQGSNNLWDISVIYNNDYEPSLLSNGSGKTVINFLHYKFSKSKLDCKLLYKGDYCLTYVTNYDCSFYDSKSLKMTNQICKSVFSSIYSVDKGKNLKPLWIILGIIGLIIFVIILFVIIYKYNCFIYNRKNPNPLKNDKTPYYNDPKNLGIDVNEIDLFNDLRNNDNFLYNSNFLLNNNSGNQSNYYNIVTKNDNYALNSNNQNFNYENINYLVDPNKLDDKEYSINQFENNFIRKDLEDNINSQGNFHNNDIRNPNFDKEYKNNNKIYNKDLKNENETHKEQRYNVIETIELQKYNENEDYNHINKFDNNIDSLMEQNNKDNYNKEENNDKTNLELSKLRDLTQNDEKYNKIDNENISNSDELKHNFGNTLQKNELPIYNNTNFEDNIEKFQNGVINYLSNGAIINKIEDVECGKEKNTINHLSYEAKSESDNFKSIDIDDL